MSIRSRLKHKTTCAAVLTLSMSAAFLCGCDSLQAALGATEAPDTAYVDTRTPEPAPSPAPERFSINPVYDFCFEARSFCRDGEEKLIRALADEGSAETFALSFSLSSHVTYVSEPRITVCRLFEDDYGNYSGTVSGAAEGTGSISALVPGIYSVSFLYADGESGLVGEYREASSAFEFSSGTYKFSAPAATPTPDPDGVAVEATPVAAFTPKCKCSIKRTEDGWESTVDLNGKVSFFATNGTTISFYANGIHAVLEGDRLSITQDDTPLITPPAE